MDAHFPTAQYRCLSWSKARIAIDKRMRMGFNYTFAFWHSTLDGGAEAPSFTCGWFVWRMLAEIEWLLVQASGTTWYSCFFKRWCYQNFRLLKACCMLPQYTSFWHSKHSIYILIWFQSSSESLFSWSKRPLVIKTGIDITVRSAMTALVMLDYFRLMCN